MKKLLLGLLLAALPFLSVAAFSKAECVELAEQAFAAQSVLNQSKPAFEATTALIEQTPADEMGVPEEFKKYLLSIVKKLKQGDNPQTIGMVVFEGCMAKLKAI